MSGSLRGTILVPDDLRDAGLGRRRGTVLMSCSEKPDCGGVEGAKEGRTDRGIGCARDGRSGGDGEFESVVCIVASFCLCVYSQRIDDAVGG